MEAHHRFELDCCAASDQILQIPHPSLQHGIISDERVLGYMSWETLTPQTPWLALGRAGYPAEGAVGAMVGPTRVLLGALQLCR